MSIVSLWAKRDIVRLLKELNEALIGNNAWRPEPSR
jgi:hypothetical protein